MRLPPDTPGDSVGVGHAAFTIDRGLRDPVTMPGRQDPFLDTPVLDLAAYARRFRQCPEELLRRWLH